MKAKVLSANTSYGEKYNTDIEKIIPTLSNEKLLDIELRIEDSLWENISSDLKYFLSYIWILTNAELISRTISTSDNLWTQKPTPSNWKIKLTPKQVTEASKEIITLQNTMSREMIEFSNTFFDAYTTEYEEKWDFEVSLSAIVLDVENYFQVTLKNYSARINGLDSNIQWDMTVKYDSQDGDAIYKADASGEVNMISKDGIIYLKTNNVEINLSEQLSQQSQYIVDALTKLWKEDTFLKYEDESSLLIDEIINWLNSKEKLNTVIDAAAKKVLFEAYDITNDTYLVRPTIEFCSLIKKSLTIFDPFAGSNCTKWQYNDMLDAMMSSGISILLTPWVNKILKVEINNSEVIWYIEIKYSDYGLNSITWNIFEPESSTVNNIDFQYIAQEEFKLNMNLEDMFILQTEIILSKSNTIKSAEMSLITYNYWDTDTETSKTIATYQKWIFDMNLEINFWYLMVSCNANGTIKNTFWDISGACDIAEEDYFTGEFIDYSLTAEATYDFKNNKNNFNVNFEYTWDENINISFLMKNTWTRKWVREQEIIIPKSVENLWDFLEKNDIDFYPSYYDYSDYTLEEKSFPEYEQSCYIYSNGEINCDNYYKDYTEYCYDNTATTGRNYCNRETDDYYYDGRNDTYYYYDE